MTAALHFRTARDMLDKVRRERDRYVDALDKADRELAADHFFNRAVTVLAVRDWIIETAPAHEGDARRLVKSHQAIARLADEANISKHYVLRSSPKSDPEIIGQTVTALSQQNGIADVDYYILRSKATLRGGTRFFHLDDADEAIAAWDEFLTARGL